VKLSASAIALNPSINAIWRGDAIEYRRSVDIALAVALNDGLVAPVVRDCANKSLSEIEAEFRALIAKAKGGKLKPEEYSDATFTISNLGAWGVEEFTAIINPPGSAILALGGGQGTGRPRRQRGRGRGRHPFHAQATLSCDHRTIDGAVGAASFVTLWPSSKSPRGRFSRREERYADFDSMLRSSAPVRRLRRRHPRRQLVLKTLVVEKDKAGGVCLNIGCIPPRPSSTGDQVQGPGRALGFGVRVDLGGFSYASVQEHPARPRTGCPSVDSCSRRMGWKTWRGRGASPAPMNSP
jgi:hypothetical protein